MSDEPILLDVRDGVAWLTLNRPAAGNALDLPMARAFLQAAIACDADPAVRCVAVTGAGRMFCAGGDIGEFRQNMGAFDRLIEDILGVLHPAVATLGALPVPVVTAINGSFGGAGLGLALCGDFAYVAASAKLRTGYVALGLSPDAGSSYFLVRRIGATRAKQLFFTNDALDAQQCLAAGIVDAVFADDRVLPEAEALCARLANASTGSIAAIKRLCDGAGMASLAQHLEREKAFLVDRARGADAVEGVTAFLERRPPVFDRR